MPKVVGSFDTSGSPVVTISIPSANEASPPVRVFDAVIDTGFTGFLQMPTQEANGLGIVARTSGDVEYADGRIRAVPLAWARVALGEATEEGFIHLHDATTEVTVGLEFLRTFRKALVLSVTDHWVLLIDSVAELFPEGPGSYRPV